MFMAAQAPQIDFCLPEKHHFIRVPAIFNVFSNVGTMCLLDNLADTVICGGLLNTLNANYMFSKKF